MCNASHWKSLVEVEISDPTVVSTNTTSYYLDFDTNVMKKVADLSSDSDDLNWVYGSMIVNHIGTTESTGTWRYDSTNYVAGGAEYSLMVFLNSTSGMVGQFWGAYT